MQRSIPFRHPHLALFHNDFDDHYRVVDQHSDGEGEATKRHHIQCLPKAFEASKRADERKRQGKHDGECGAHASEEEQDHDRGKSAADQSFMTDRLDRLANEDRLVADEIHREALHRGFEALDRDADLVYDLERICARLTIDRDINFGLAVDQNDVGLNRIGIFRVARFPRV